MELRILKDVSLRDLKNNIDIDKYSSEKPFIEEYMNSKGKINYYETLPGEYPKCELIISSDPKYDVDNSIRLYEALKYMPLVYARDEKLWSYMTHMVFWDYMKERWYSEKVDFEARYFFIGKSKEDVINTSFRPYTRNGISRLWWAAHTVYDESLPNHYEYLPDLFSTQDLFQGICERSISKNRTLTTSILRMVRKYNVNELANSKTIIREILKEINFESEITMFDTLNNEDTDEIIGGIFVEMIKKYTNS